MSCWPDSRFTDLLGIAHPLIQAPMLGAGADIMIGVAKAGGLGSLACATLSLDAIRSEVAAFRAVCDQPLNLNFFCHQPPEYDEAAIEQWKSLFKPYYSELGADYDAPTPVSSRAPFDDATCALVEELRPEVVSFHFALPAPEFVARVKASGAKVLSSATTVDEAQWLEHHGCDAIIAMGYEAGGHRAMFLHRELTTQIGTFALVPQIVDAVSVPVIAAGGIADARGIAAAFALGASAVQIGTAYLFCPEAKLAKAHHRALREASASDTALTNLFTGRPARGIVNRVMRELGPINPQAPAFPLAGGVLLPLKAKSAADSGDFINLWAGQGFPLSPGRTAELSSFELTRQFVEDYTARSACI
ncbi:NAD(P)H-dependent flavin oxidoreductase [Pseudomonas fragi]|uniref:NAD(P)H-dependent flavin oxidoreductase n=1 Tax=Pseudomonas fragi TaxID=296 RepID=UPI00030CD34A|nr:nitronate monooxygenase [Pseudomonas fragi]MDE4516644.1 nitronate monooxygenase [Pseudomonas fragi]QPC37607.1 nitronate monooxygenase [Pseudomonas fragi]SDU13692.1 nitronate monooxygenase [Pseudomonas fragi]